MCFAKVLEGFAARHRSAPTAALASAVLLVTAGCAYAANGSIPMKRTAARSAHFGDVELALRAARGATDTRRHNVWFLWLPLFDDVRSSPGFAELVADLGLVEYWRRHGWPRFCKPAGADEIECS